MKKGYSFNFPIYIVFLFVYTFAMMTPGYFQTRIVTLVSHACLVLGLIFLIINHYKPTHFIVLTTIYFAFNILNTYINHGESANFSYIIRYTKYLVYLANIDLCVCKLGKRRAITPIFYFLLIVVLIDCATIYLFPKGLYMDSVTADIAYEVPKWIFGAKNNHIIWYVVTIYLCSLLAFSNNGKAFFYKIMLIILMVLSSGAMYILESSTSLGTILICDLGLILTFLFNKKIKTKKLTTICVVCYFVFLYIILFGDKSFLEPIVESLLGKEMTFTGRTEIWEITINYIKCHPLFGVGVLSQLEAINLLRDAAPGLVNCHNHFLQVIWEGGLFLIAIYIIQLFMIVQNLNKSKNNMMRTFSLFVLIALFFEMTFEVEYGLGVWICLLCMHDSLYLENDTAKVKEKKPFSYAKMKCPERIEAL